MSEKTLSIFIDESGDFGSFEKHSPFYIVSMILHDQNIDINDHVTHFWDHLKYTNIPYHAIHAGPLVRRKSIYRAWDREKRKYLFNALFNLFRKLKINCLCVKVNKQSAENKMIFISKLSKSIFEQVKNNESFYRSFSHVIVYYDNGQEELTKIIASNFSVLFESVEFRKVRPVDYILFQIADLICTLKLVETKIEFGILSKSEKDFFGPPRDFKKNYLKCMKKKFLI